MNCPICAHLGVPLSSAQLGATPAQYDSAVAALRYRASVPQLPPSLNDGEDAMDEDEDEDEEVEDEYEASREARVFAEEGDELYARSDHRHSSHRQSGGGGGSANSVDVVVLLDDDDAPPAQARVR